MMTFATRVSQPIALRPAPTIAEPIRPPNSACEEDDGRPNSQVATFHTIAAITPAKMNAGVIAMPPPDGSSLMIPFEMVRATAVDRNAPTRFSTAARATAVRGFSARVAIGVAIAFAVSWKPFVKSKMRAIAITRTTIHGSTEPG